MGLNYYVTSERYLDENTDSYPVHMIGGNGKHQYVDIEAVRSVGLAGIDTLIKETWDRYQIPIAITECHLNCSREEQLRWFNEIWTKCCELSNSGIEIEAVTAWALLGAYDWNSLLREVNNHYESGIFSIQHNFRRPTALATLVSSLAQSGKFDHPLLSQDGWWKHQSGKTKRKSIIKTPFVLIIGKHGILAQAFANICERRSIPFLTLSQTELNICVEQDIIEAIENYRPWAVINTTDYVGIDDAEVNAAKCFLLNESGPRLLAKVSRVKGVKFMTFSSDLVFDGKKNQPYDESDAVNPLNVYGASKAAGESAVLKANDSSLIIRSGALFSPWDRSNFAYRTLKSLKQNEKIRVATDVTVSPTYVPDLIDISMDLLIDDEKGIWHLSNEGMFTWAEFAQELAQRGGFRPHQLELQPCSQMAWKARRPLYSVLHSEKGLKLPSLENSLNRFFSEQAV